MNLFIKKNTLPLSAALLGICAMLLHLGIRLLGTDRKGLLISTHPMAIALWAVTAVACLMALLPLRNPGIGNAGSDSSAPSVSAAIGAFALAGGIAVTVIGSFGTWIRLEQLRNICGLLAIPSLILLGLNRFSGKRSFFLFHALVCLYLTLHTVSHYQIWSSRPQWLNWFFPMAASVLLTLFSYHQTAFDVDLGNRKAQMSTGLLAVFFCIGAVFQENSMLYLGGALWSLSSLCSLTPATEKDDGHASA